MIYYTTPFDSGLNIGEYYNRFVELLPNDDDYACFIDADTIFTTSDYGVLLEQVIRENPDVDCFTCYTNRVNCKWQVPDGVDTTEDDYKYHREFGQKLKDKYGSSVADCTNTQLFSGMFFMVKKSSWMKFGGAKPVGMLGVDNDIHKKIIKNRMKLYLIKGLYLYHWHRGSCVNNISTHLKKKPSVNMQKNKITVSGGKRNLSVVICRTDKDMSDNLVSTLKNIDNVNYDFVIYDNTDGKTLSQVYNESVKKAKYENVLLVHQDVLFKDSDFSAILEKLDEKDCGCIGFAGSKVRVKNVSSWNQIEEFNATNYYESNFGKHKHRLYPSCTNINPGFSNVITLDGFAMFTKKSLVEQYGFDTEKTGFHGYDLDYTIRLSLSGYRNYVYTWFDVKVLHLSPGKFNKDWFKTIINLTYTKWGDSLPMRTGDIGFDYFKKKIVTGVSNANKLFQKRLNTLSRDDRKEVIDYFNLMCTMKNSPQKNNKKVIYTCITGKYDVLTNPLVITPDFDYVCFTDNDELVSDIWKIKPMPEELSGYSSVKQQRLVKINPHKYLSEYDLSIWIDGSITVLSDITDFVSSITNQPNWSEVSIYTPSHPRRDCIYKEADACIRMKKDKAENVNAQMDRYRKEGFPERYGLPQTNIVLRRHNDAKCVEVMEAWAEELRNNSHRDQLSFNYAVWKTGNSGSVCYLPKDTCNSRYFKWNSTHSKSFSIKSSSNIKLDKKELGKTFTIN